MLRQVCIALALLGAVPFVGSGLKAEEPLREWGRVRALRPGQPLVVRPFKGMGGKVVGAYVSSDDSEIVVRMRNDQAVAVAKERIRQVVWRRPMRYSVVSGAAAGFALCSALTLTESDFVQPVGALIFGGACAGLGALAGFGVRALGRDRFVYRAPKPGRGPSKNS